MTDLGRKVLPPLDEPFRPDPDVVQALREAGVYETFCSFAPLYRRVRLYNVAFYKGRDSAAYQKALEHLIEETKAGKTYGQWNDYGRLQ